MRSSVICSPYLSFDVFKTAPNFTRYSVTITYHWHRSTIDVFQRRKSLVRDELFWNLAHIIWLTASEKSITAFAMISSSAIRSPRSFGGIGQAKISCCRCLCWSSKSWQKAASAFPMRWRWRRNPPWPVRIQTNAGSSWKTFRYVVLICGENWWVTRFFVVRLHPFWATERVSE